jgi:hypothetical protein
MYATKHNPRFARIVAAALLLTSVVASASAQTAPSPPARTTSTATTGSISGRVQNEATSQYLNNARITVKGTNLTAFTDDFGNYRLSRVPGGNVTLQVFYSGLDPQEVTVNLSPGQSVERDINLTNRATYG